MVEFKIKEAYKAQMAYRQTTLGTLHSKSSRYLADRIMMNKALLRESPWYQALPKDMQESLIRMMSISKDVT